MPAQHATSSESKARGTRAPTATQCRQEVLNMLKEDHRRVEKAFKDFEKLQKAEDQDPAACQSIVEQTCMELEVHARLEEECFYPAVREAIEETDLIDEAEVEHQTVKTLISQLQSMQPQDDKFAATFTVLGEYVMHHVKEEEGEMFRKLTRAKIDWANLLDTMQEQREALMEEVGAPEPGANGKSGAKGKRSH
ncbi:MAG: hemerythrin domain-containing protein [Aquabacterium sp.]